MSDPLKIEIVMLAVQRRVLPLQGETAVEHAVRLYKIAGDCMAALEAKVEAEEPAPAAPSSVFVWDLPLGKKWVTISKQLKD
jgi:hypothetical protein